MKLNWYPLCRLCKSVVRHNGHVQLSIRVRHALSVLTGNFEQTEPMPCLFKEKMEVLLGQQLSQRLVFQFQLQACLMKGKEATKATHRTTSVVKIVSMMKK